MYDVYRLVFSMGLRLLLAVVKLQTHDRYNQAYTLNIYVVWLLKKAGTLCVECCGYTTELFTHSHSSS